MPQKNKRKGAVCICCENSGKSKIARNSRVIFLLSADGKKLVGQGINTNSVVLGRTWLFNLIDLMLACFQCN
jgi:hypothetical protein